MSLQPGDDLLGATLLGGEHAAELQALLVERGVLLFRGPDVTPEQQVAALLAVAPTLKPELSDLAVAVAGYKSVDIGKLDAMAGQLEGMTGPDRPFRMSARELQALALLKKGDLKGARAIWDEISKDGTAPAGVAQRTAAMLALYPAPVETKPATDAKPAETK